MVREVKRISLKTRIDKIAFSPFIFPVLFLLFSIFTVPIIYITTQSPQDIRQRAATIASGPIAIDTNEISYEKATLEVINQDSVNIIGLLTGVVIVLITMVAVIVYRRKVTTLTSE